MIKERLIKEFPKLKLVDIPIVFIDLKYDFTSKHAFEEAI